MNDTRERIRSLLTLNPRMTVRDLVRETGVSRQRVYKLLSEMELYPGDPHVGRAGLMPMTARRMRQLLSWTEADLEAAIERIRRMRNESVQRLALAQLEYDVAVRFVWGRKHTE
jgi:hypothetical protein